MELLKLENQFKQPVVVANISKRRQQIRKKNSSGKAALGLQSASPDGSGSGDLRHDFVEGPDMTLADLVLYPLFMCLLVSSVK